jgi:hypothetical protein
VRIPIALIWALVLPGSISAQVSGQTFEVSPEARRATVGDTVTLRFRVRLDERDLLFDTVPEPLSVPAGVRLLSIDKLARTPDRIFQGKARIAFYRPGRQAVPIFMLPFMRAVKGVQRATLASDSAFIEIGAVLPPGNPPLKDIRELKLNTGPAVGLFASGAAVALLLLGCYAAFRRRRWRPEAPVSPLPIPATEAGAYHRALAQLAQIERAGWPAKGQTARHYERVVNVLREYLDAAEGVPARERTTEELLWALPLHLSEEGRREVFRDLLDEADLVKFARLRPSSESAECFLERSRSLLREWGEAAAMRQVVDAVR